MNLLAKGTLLVGLCFLNLGCVFGQTTGSARGEMRKGVYAYKAQKYDEAVEHFERAAALEPDLLEARLYLGSSYAQLYIPG